jgi:AraC-like DNA-binding protein
VSPKWVIARYRLFEAAEALADRRRRNLALTAMDLGYYDQAHFIMDFKRIAGMPPARYSGSLRRKKGSVPLS